MNASETDSGAGQSRDSGFGVVGAELAAARETKQLSQESVASELHLRPEIVRAIETGDEAKLPAAAFARGYIKSYARLLGLDEKAIIARLPDLHPQRAAPLKRVGMRRSRISLPVGKWLLRGLLLSAVVALLVYAVPVMERLWTKEAPEPVAGRLPLPLYGDDEADDTVQILEPDQPPKSGDEQTQLLRSEPETAGEQVTGEQIAGEQPTREQPAMREQSVETPLAETPPDSQGAAGPAIVHLRFTEDSWVEMEAHGRKLVVGTQRAGSERTVRVEPPVSVLLGNSPGVELSYRGKPVDLTPYQRGNVARLTLED